MRSGAKAAQYRSGVFGAVALLAGVLLMLTNFASAQSETVLYNFGWSDGANPLAGLAKDSKGNFYGTTANGGAYGHGTVYKVSATGAETVLYSFTGGADGATPFYAGVVLDKSGNIYGTTSSGGANNQGTVFELTPSGIETVLHSFANDGVDGNTPFAGVALDKKGNLYGTTYGGGTNGYGIVFKVDPSGNETVLHSFAYGDGCNPSGAGVVVGKKGVLYGTAFGCGAYAFGTVFTVSQSGSLTVLHNFNNDGTDGLNPYAGVVLDKAGNIYGTTLFGGAGSNGTVFKITPSGSESVLHALNGGTEGYYPYGAGVILDNAGNLYGITTYGGSNGYGTVFKLDPSGSETVLNSFASNATDGRYPIGNLVLKGKSLYGAANSGGASGYGAVYKVTP